MATTSTRVVPLNVPTPTDTAELLEPSTVVSFQEPSSPNRANADDETEEVVVINPRKLAQEAKLMDIASSLSLLQSERQLLPVDLAACMLNSTHLYTPKLKRVGFSRPCFVEHFAGTVCMPFAACFFIKSEGWIGYWRGRVVSTWSPGWCWCCTVATLILSGFEHMVPAEAIILATTFLYTAATIALQYALLDGAQQANFLAFYKAASLAKRTAHIDDPLDVAQRQTGIHLQKSKVLLADARYLDQYIQATSGSGQAPPRRVSNAMVSRVITKFGGQLATKFVRTGQMEAVLQAAVGAYSLEKTRTAAAGTCCSYPWSLPTMTLAQELIQRGTSSTSYTATHLRYARVLAAIGCLLPFAVQSMMVASPLQWAIAVVTVFGLFPLMFVNLRYMIRLLGRARTKNGFIRSIDAMLDIEDSRKANLPFADLRFKSNVIAWSDLFTVLANFQMDNHVNSEAVLSKLLATMLLVTTGTLVTLLCAAFRWIMLTPYTLCILAYVTVLGCASVLTVALIEADTNRVISEIPNRVTFVLNVIAQDLAVTDVSETEFRAELLHARDLLHAKLDELRQGRYRSTVLGVTITFALTRTLLGAVLSAVITILSIILPNATSYVSQNLAVLN